MTRIKTPKGLGLLPKTWTRRKRRAETVQQSNARVRRALKKLGL